MRILALDLATKTGWAHSMGVSGVWDCGIRRDESSGMRLIRLAGKLEQISGTVGIDLLVFEAARHAAPKMQGALVVQAEMQGVVKAFCECRQIQYRGYSPSEIKKYATGKGGCNKAAMMAAAKARWPTHQFVDDNEADAKFLLSLAVEAAGGEIKCQLAAK